MQGKEIDWKGVAHLFAIRIENPEAVELELRRCRERRIATGGDPAEYDAAIQMLLDERSQWYQTERLDLERLRAVDEVRAAADELTQALAGVV